jgi:hypothetical protein
MVFDFFPSAFFYKAYFIFFLQSVSGTVIGSYQEFSESGYGNMIEGLLKNIFFVFNRLWPIAAKRGRYDEDMDSS